MTEKDYSGVATSKIGKSAKADTRGSRIETSLKIKEEKTKAFKQAQKGEIGISDKSENEKIKSYRKAGQIAKQVKEFTKSIIKRDMLLVEIAEKIEAEIIKLGGELAFPVNLSIDDVAAHYTPTLRDEKRASGLLKVDIGIHVNGFIADTAFSIDSTPEKKHAKLIEASEKALQAALEEVKSKKSQAILSEIGRKIKEAIASYGFSPIINLSGHGLEQFDIHSGLTIPNYDNGNTKRLGEGAFAIEPFATPGAGSVYDGAGSNIYHIARSGQVRDNFSRQVLAWLIENKKTLPFSQRELEKKFGSKALIAISNLKRTGLIEEFSQLVEKNHQPVSQAEASFIIYDNKVEIIIE